MKLFDQKIVDRATAEQICARLGHVEDVTDMYGPGAHVEVKGCLRCDLTLDVTVHEGRFPLPRGDA